jgi:N-methylhydantoinase B
LSQEAQELILLNCQVRREPLSDLRAQMRGEQIGACTACRRFAADTVLGVGAALQDYVERKMKRTRRSADRSGNRSNIFPVRR